MCSNWIRKVRRKDTLRNPVQFDSETDSEEADEVDYREPLLAYEDT